MSNHNQFYPSYLQPTTTSDFVFMMSQINSHPGMGKPFFNYYPAATFAYNSYLKNDLAAPKNVKSTQQQPQWSKDRKLESSENVQNHSIHSSSFSGNGKQRSTSYDDQILKSKKANKDILKKTGFDSKKTDLNSGAPIIVIDDDDDQIQEINEQSESSQVIMIGSPKQVKESVKNREIATNESSKGPLNQFSDRIFGNTTFNNSYPLKKIACLSDQSDKCDTILITSQSNANKASASTAALPSAQAPSRKQQGEEKKNNTPQNDAPKLNEQVIISSDDDSDDQEFKPSEDSKELYCFSHKNKTKSVHHTNVSCSTTVKILPQTQYNKLLQVPSKGQTAFNPIQQNQIPLYEPRQSSINSIKDLKDDDIQICSVIDTHKQLKIEQQKTNPHQSHKIPYNLSQVTPQPYTFNGDKCQMKTIQKQIKSSSSIPQFNGMFNNGNFSNYEALQQQHHLKKLKQKEFRPHHSSSSHHGGFGGSTFATKVAQQLQSQKNGGNSRNVDQIQSPTLNNNSNSFDERDGKSKKLIINSKYVYCKKCDKQVESSQMRRGGLDALDLCKSCFQVKQKNEQQEKRYWELMFRNAEDRQNQTEIGKEYQAVVPEYSMTNLEQWREKNKQKFQAILASKVHCADDNQLYTDVITLIRTKYNENYSHNDFLAFMKNAKLTLREMKDRMENDDVSFLNQIEACSSNTCKNQRVTRLTKRRLEYLQNY